MTCTLLPGMYFPTGLFPPGLFLLGCFYPLVFPVVLSPLGLFPTRSFAHYTQKKNDQHMRVIGLLQNRLAHASKLSRLRVNYQHKLVSLTACAGKLTRNIVNLLAYAIQLGMCKIAFLCVSVLMQVISFFTECRSFPPHSFPPLSFHPKFFPL